MKLKFYQCVLLWCLTALVFLIILKLSSIHKLYDVGNPYPKIEEKCKNTTFKYKNTTEFECAENYLKQNYPKYDPSKRFRPGNGSI